MQCSSCGATNVGELHVVVSRVLALLESQKHVNIERAILLVQQHFDPNGPPIRVEWSDCVESGVGGWARANSKRIVICDAAREPSFQYAQSTEVPDYAADYGVTHLTVVVLHELGHVLDRRHMLPPSVTNTSDDKEEIANEFVHYVLNI